MRDRRKRMLKHHDGAAISILEMRLIQPGSWAQSVSDRLEESGFWGNLSQSAGSFDPRDSGRSNVLS
jgi:hypothetical protein